VWTAAVAPKNSGPPRAPRPVFPEKKAPSIIPRRRAALNTGVTGRLPRTDVNATRQGRFGHIALGVSDRHTRSNLAGRQMLRSWLVLNADMGRG